MGTVTARQRAIASESRQIKESQSRAIAAAEAERKPRTALEAMAMRHLVSPDVLQNMLRKTAFSACKTNEEFVAMVLVSNQYGLNPLLKEIHAFAGKGGGIMPMVGVDGWMRIMNEHPQFDGIEFDYHLDEKGGVEAIESIIYRKDRNHPIKVIEYLEECRRNTDPWRQSPRRMLRHRALIQGARLAFGFSGIAAEGDEDEFSAIPAHGSTPSLPSQQSLAEELDDEIPALRQDETVDEDTGEVIETDGRGMSVVDEKTAQALDAAQTLQDIDGPLDDDAGKDDDVVDIEADFIGAKPQTAEVNQTWYNPDGGQLRYAHHTGHGLKWYLKPQEEAPAEPAAEEAAAADEPETEPAFAKWVRKIKKGIKEADTKAFLDSVEKDYLAQCVALPKEVADDIEAMLHAKRKQLLEGR